MEKKIDKLNEIVNCIEPMIDEQICDTINWHLSLKSTRFLNPEIKNMDDDELYKFESLYFYLLSEKLFFVCLQLQ